MINQKIGIINYGSGNFSSVWNALRFLNVDLVEVDCPKRFSEVHKIILPGVGAFPACMEKLNTLGIIDSLNEYIIGKNMPYLGICVGMQILSERGHEFKLTNGLNWIKGETKKIEANRFSLKLPHIGWNECVFDKDWQLFRNLEGDPCFYFVNSYAMVPQGDLLKATTTYGVDFISAIQKENIFGVQFHPEKSQRNGLKLLENFLKIK